MAYQGCSTPYFYLKSWYIIVPSVSFALLSFWVIWDHNLTLLDINKAHHLLPSFELILETFLTLEVLSIHWSIVISPNSPFWSISKSISRILIVYSVYSSFQPLIAVETLSTNRDQKLPLLSISCQINSLGQLVYPLSNRFFSILLGL